jgi:hypothetical protein
MITLIEGDPTICGLEPLLMGDTEFSPNELFSWRGVYSQASTSPNRSGETMTVSDFLKMLKRAMEIEHDGYKGGMYRFNLETPIWADAWGSYREQGCTGITRDGSTIRIVVSDCGTRGSI